MIVWAVGEVNALASGWQTIVACEIAGHYVRDVDEVSRPSPAADDTAMPTERQSPIGSIMDGVRHFAFASPSEDEQAALDELIPEGDDFIPFMRRFAMLTALSAGIAAFGLLSNSAAVVIGAMLVAPLMGPITAAAAATVRAQNRRLVQSIAVIAFGMALAVFVGYLTSAVAGFEIIGVADLPNEVSSRTFPALLDLGVAITAGAAAGYISPRRSTTSALPGVGIAVALVPPLASVGILLELGLGAEAGNAMLLFLTNLAAIVFAASVMLLLAGFRPHEAAGHRSLRIRLTFTLLAVIVVAVPLTRHTQSTLRDADLRRAVVQSVAEWDESVRLIELTADVGDGVGNVELIVSGPNEARPAWRLADEIRAAFGGAVELELRYERDELHVVSAR
jgi:uncharacterized hydrophobic protein (TIGR00271 family)